MSESKIAPFIPEGLRRKLPVLASLLVTITIAMTACSQEEAQSKVQAQLTPKPGLPTTPIEIGMPGETQQTYNVGDVTITETTKTTDSGSNTNLFALSELNTRDIIFTIGEQTLRISVEENTFSAINSPNTYHVHSIYYDLGNGPELAGEIVYSKSPSGNLTSEPHMDHPAVLNFSTEDGNPYRVTFEPRGNDGEVQLGVKVFSDDSFHVPVLPWEYLDQ